MAAAKGLSLFWPIPMKGDFHRFLSCGAHMTASGCSMEPSTRKMLEIFFKEHFQRTGFFQELPSIQRVWRSRVPDPPNEKVALYVSVRPNVYEL